MLHSELLLNDDAFRLLEGEWDDLVKESMTHTPFQYLAYQRAWWTHLGPGNLYTVVLRDAAGTLRGLAPFILQDGALQLNGSFEETDYLDLITRADDAETAWQAVFDCISSPQFPEWQVLDLCVIPQASPTRSIVPQLAASRGFVFSAEIHEVCPVIELPATFDEYLAGLDKKNRHEARRKMRKAVGAGAALRVVGPADDLDAAMADFLDLLQKSTPEKAAWLNEGRTAVFNEVAQAAQAAGTLQLMFFEVDGEKAAALFNFDYDGRIWVYNSGLDPTTYGYLGAGVVLSAWAIEHAIENGRAAFDFLRGSEEYKYRFGAKDTTVHRLRVGRS